MTLYAWQGVNSSGKTVKGTRNADNLKILRVTLKKDGIYLTKASERAASEVPQGLEISFKNLVNKISTSDMASTTQQLAVLLKSGVPLVESLDALLDQIENQNLRSAFLDIKEKVNEGSSLTNALKFHDKYFSNLYINMIAAGEASGTLEIVLERLAEFLNNQAKLKGKIISATAYPSFMALASMVIIFIMITVVVPKVTTIFEDFEQALPWYTELLIMTSKFIIRSWWILIVVMITSIFLFRQWLQSPKGRERWDALILKFPIFGKLILMVAISRFSRTLSTLLGSGVPMLKALEITQNILGNVTLMSHIQHAYDSVVEGESLAKPLQKDHLFPTMVIHMIAVGEKSGQLEKMLEHIANNYDQQIDVRVQTMTSLLEPIIIILMGGISAMISFSILMPLLKINDFIG